MSLKYTTVNQYNNGGQAHRLVNRLPAGCQRIETAPVTSTPVVVYEPNGRGRWAVNHLGSWRELKPFRNGNDGKVQWRMDGTIINNAVGWLPRPPQRQR
jgi:hypothetical protein